MLRVRFQQISNEILRKRTCFDVVERTAVEGPRNVNKMVDRKSRQSGQNHFAFITENIQQGSRWSLMHTDRLID